MADRLAIDGGTPVIVEPIPSGVHGPSAIDEREINAVTEVLRSGRLFRFVEDSHVAAFETEAAALLGVNHALMVNSGTSAIICALTGIGVGPGDEVIIPGYTFIATAAAVVGVGAIPVIAEIDESLGMDPADVERKITPHTKAILPVHMQGVPCRLDDLMAIAQRHGLKVVEDCCQCVGGRYKGAYTGTWGEAGAWSLNYFKVISCGEGGMVFTDDYDIYERTAFASDAAMPMWMSDKEWQNPPFSRQGYRPSEIMGSIARVQLSKLEDILSHTRRLKKAFLSQSWRNRRDISDSMSMIRKVNAASAQQSLSKIRNLPRNMSKHSRQKAWEQARRTTMDFQTVTSTITGIQFCLSTPPHPSGYPWKDPAYKGNVEYSRDMCPQTLSILGRALRFGFNVNMQEDHARFMAAAINKVDAVLG